MLSFLSGSDSFQVAVNHPSISLYSLLDVTRFRLSDFFRKNIVGPFKGETPPSLAQMVLTQCTSISKLWAIWLNMGHFLPSRKSLTEGRFRAGSRIPHHKGGEGRYYQDTMLIFWKIDIISQILYWTFCLDFQDMLDLLDSRIPLKICFFWGLTKLPVGSRRKMLSHIQRQR